MKHTLIQIKIQYSRFVEQTLNHFFYSLSVYIIMSSTGHFRISQSLSMVAVLMCWLCRRRLIVLLLIKNLLPASSAHLLYILKNEPTEKLIGVKA